MKSDITKLQINTIIALALMRYLYRKREISEKVYRKILQKYGKVVIAKESKLSAYSGYFTGIRIRSSLSVRTISGSSFFVKRIF